MIIHSIYLRENILPPGRNERQKFLLAYDEEVVSDPLQIQSPKYEFEPLPNGIIVRNHTKDVKKQAACFLPWSNILQVIYKPGENAVRKEVKK